MARSIRSGFWRANSQMTGQPIELPTSVADSSSRSSMKAAAAAARSGTSSGWRARPLRPNPGRSGTRVWNSPARRSAVGTRYRPERPKPCRCIITGASGDGIDSR